MIACHLGNTDGDRILDVLPIGVTVFPGSGISTNLADKAKKLGIPVSKYGGA